MMRERMVNLRATSAPLRSSAGCGSFFKGDQSRENEWKGGGGVGD